MSILINHVNVDAIRGTLKYLSIDGATTNPSILYHEGREPLEALHNVRVVLPTTSQLHVQIVSETVEAMVDKARALCSELGGNLFVKLSVTREDFRTIPLVVTEGVQVTTTGIHSSVQGFMATKTGARYVAPYTNRVDNYGIDGVRVATEIYKTLRSYGLEAGILAASFKNSEQVLELACQGIGTIATVPDVLEALTKNPVMDVAIVRQNRHSDVLVGNKGN